MDDKVVGPTFRVSSSSSSGRRGAAADEVVQVGRLAGCHRLVDELEEPLRLGVLRFGQHLFGQTAPDLCMEGLLRLLLLLTIPPLNIPP